MPRTDILDYYVTTRRGKRTALLAGPFATHTEALANVSAATAAACDVDPWADFDAFGTSSLPRDLSNPVGKLNRQIGVTPRALSAPPY